MRKARVAVALDRTGLRRLFGRAWRWSGVLVLNYHRIGCAAGSPFDHGLWSASEEAFSEQLRFLKHETELIVPGDLPQVRAHGRGRHAMVTFDDGYRDNYEAAFPLLRREGVRAAFFVTTGFIDRPGLPWWDEIAWMVRQSERPRLDLGEWLAMPVEVEASDREHVVRQLLRVYKELPQERAGTYLDALAEATGTGRADAARHAGDFWMTWDMLREMRDAGMTIGGHTVSHPVLANMEAGLQRAEIQQCGRRLREELGRPMECFSYPVGNRESFDRTTRTLLHEAGVRWAFSYYGGLSEFDAWDDYDIRRVAVETEVDHRWFRSLVTIPPLLA